ncbi:MAG: 4Fe-4S binding protein [Planctomycetota bacterium]|jgi:polyferredoxin
MNMSAGEPVNTEKGERRSSWVAPLVSVLVTGGLLVPVHLKVRPSILLLERFFPGTGWIEILLVSVYAAVITHLMLHPRRSALWRLRIWTFFSLVFFAQFAAGLFGVGAFLMTGNLHFPIPAFIVAGPVYRGGGFIMVAIFGGSVLLAGRAWCSHLCYIGAWDAQAARLRKRPASLPLWRIAIPLGILFLVVASALLLRFTGMATPVVNGFSAGFGILSILVMVLFSTRSGQMAHCVAFCPIGVLNILLGRLHPFRIGIDDRCTDCGLCTKHCRYGALSKADISKRCPGLSCTLCGDCVGTCPHRALGYRFFGLTPERARAFFLVVVVSLHAVFLATARM